jgi:hypothetical protein
MRSALLATLVLAAGCVDSELVGVWQSEQTTEQGFYTRITFEANGSRLVEEFDPQTMERVSDHRNSFSTDGVRMRVFDDPLDVFFPYAVRGDRLMVVALRPLSEHRGVLGRWQADYTDWAKPGSDKRGHHLEIEAGTGGAFLIVETSDLGGRSFYEGTWTQRTADSYSVEFFKTLAPRTYVLLDDVLTADGNIYRRMH